MRSDGLLCVAWYLIPHTQIRAVMRKIYSYCDNTYISQQQIKVALSYNRLFATLFVTRRLR